MYNRTDKKQATIATHTHITMYKITPIKSIEIRISAQ